ncbi:unnamed protein product [Urochloa humidicola]
MADKVDKKLAACLSLPTTVQKQQQQQQKAPLFPAVQLISLCALLTAAILVVSYAVGFAPVLRHIHPVKILFIHLDAGFQDGYLD